MIVKQGRTPRIMPFAMDGIERDPSGVLRYTGLQPSLLHMLTTLRADMKFRR